MCRTISVEPGQAANWWKRSSTKLPIFIDARATHLEVKIDKLQATLGTLEAQNQALEAKLDRVLGAVAV